MEDTKYYIRIQNQNVGPLTYDEIVSKLKKSELKGEDHIFAVGSSGWVQIKTIMQFSAYTNSQGTGNKNEQEVWYIHKNKENLGPFSAERIVKMINEREIDTSDYVFRKGISGWTQIKEITELTDLLKGGDSAEGKQSSSLEKISMPEPQLEEFKELEENTAVGEMPVAAEEHAEERLEEIVIQGERKNIPEFIFGLLLVVVALLNLAASFLASVMVAFIGIGFIAYYFVKNKKGRRAHAG